MKVRITPFIEFAYGDKRRDVSTVKRIVSDMDKDYDPATDRYKQFREALRAYEDGNLSERDFLNLSDRVSDNKSGGYKILCENYLNLKEDHGLVWEGAHKAVALFGSLEIHTAWYLRTDSQNQRRIVFLNFRKEPFPRKQERGILTILQLAEPEASGVGVLNIQSGTLVVSSRLGHSEQQYLALRAEKFSAISDKS